MVHLHSRMIHNKSGLLQQTTGTDGSGVYMHHDFILDNDNNTAYGAHKLNPTDTVSSDVGLATLGSRRPCEGEVELKAGKGQSGQRPVASGIIAYSHGCQRVIVL